ncbi:MAG TPA: aminotransferase class V-fold PLP-dependent enzyme [Blastocatellia bacterium]|nr:aminotransferase class V-fold PLP-dependent enzyme [Blastocatellia bacterium]
MQKKDSSPHGPLEAAFRNALSYLENLDETPVAATADLLTLRNRLSKPLTSEGVDPEQIIDELVKDVNGGLLGSPGGRFFGWVVGGSLSAALAADWLTATWDQNAALYACSPASAIVEEVVGLWLKDILGLPASASFALVTGCQMAHVTCLAAARHSLLVRRGWDVEQQGLFGAPPIRILSSSERHGSIERAVRLLGLGHAQVIDLQPDSGGRLQPETIEQALQSDPSALTIVLLQAGDLNIGAYDPFETVIPIAKRYGAWVHVDGAFGLWVAASPLYRHLVRGIEAADSWATDGHKWLNVPYDCGYAFVADAKSHLASMSHRAAYLVHDEDARDQMDWNPEWSRRGRGFPTYAALRQLGRDGVANLVERCCKHAHSIVMRVGALPGAEVLSEPTINQGLVRFLDPRPNASEKDHDDWTDKVIAAILTAGEAFFGGTTWRGRRAMRVSVCNWQTSDEDVERVVASVAQVMKSLNTV